MAKTKVELQNYQGESLSPITIASNVLYEDGRNAQEVFEEYSNETFTPTIENSGSMFKVGQGDNVDYSSNVVNGAYESMVLKGKTMVNCIQEPSSKDVVLPYEFADGQYVTINDTKESGALGVELKGRTLVNISEINRFSISGSGKTLYTTKKLIKDNTTYTRMVYISKNTLTGVNERNCVAQLVEGNNTIFSHDIQIALNETGLICNETFNSGTTSSKNNTSAVRIFTVNTGGVLEGYEIILEGNYTNVDIPYFTGMTSCKMPTLHTVGKNLIVGGDTIKEFTKDTDFSINYPSFKLHDDIDPNSLIGKTLTLSCRVKKTAGKTNNPNQGSLGGRFGIHATLRWTNASGQTKTEYPYAGLLSEHDNNTDGVISQTCTFTPPSGYDRISSFNFSIQLYARPSGNDTWSFGQVQMELGSSATTYEPYKSSILSLPEEVVLRSLPNGVRDTFNTRTGEYVQRIGEIVFDGSQNKANWGTANYENENFIQFYWADTLVAKNNSGDGIKVNCDRFPVYSPNSLISPNPQKIGVSSRRNNSQGIVFSLTKTDMPSFSGESVNSYFAQNPTIICYELATPIVTKINLSSTLKSWNTTTHIYSEIPENTLYPTLSHSNPTYPVILKPSTKYSIVANSYSNDHTNSTINFNLGGTTASTTVGNRVTTVTTPSTLSNELLTMSGRGNKLNNVMVIEGDVVGDEPYFEGICDSKSPILSNVGKNLCDVNRYTLSCGSGVALNGYGKTVIAKNIKVKPNTKYVFSYGETVNIPSNIRLKVMTFTDMIEDKINVHVDAYSHKNRIKEHSVSNGEMFTTESHARYIAITTGNFTTTGDILIEDIEIKEATSPTAYESYKSNTTTFDQKDGKTIVLRSLPNGVCDTLNVETGEYVQRIGEVTKNNSTGFGLSGGGWENKSDVCTFEHFRPEGMKVQLAHDKPTLNCDKVPSNTFSTQWSNSKGIESITQHDGGGIVLSITRDKLLTQDTDGLNTYLQSNPLTIQYELATPIVSTIDVQGFPYAYENGHVQLSSGHNAQSLTPKVEYSVATNRNGQIRSNQKMVERHQKQLDQLQAIILANMVNTQYQQTLTTLNYDLLKKEVGE